MSWVASNTKKQSGGSIPTGYIRPSDWPAIPAIADGSNKFVGLFAVFNSDSNFCALSASGAYTIDWGDGSAAENIASGVQANHVYDYATCGGVECTRGYKTVIVTVTPQSGQTFSALDLSKKHNSTTTGENGYLAPWLDIAVDADFSATGLKIGTTSSTSVALRLLEKCIIFGAGSATSLTYLFNSCTSLQSVSVDSTASCTNFSGMFYNCASLQVAPDLNTSIGTTFNSMFYGCASLTTIPLYNTGAGTLFGSMFYRTYSLVSVPALDLRNATETTNMHLDNISLKKSSELGPGISISYLNAMLSAAAIEEIFTNLPTVASGTIVVTGNYGSASLTAGQLLIATAKGWTVTQ